jgi:hypothetical protein
MNRLEESKMNRKEDKKVIVIILDGNDNDRYR